MEFVKFFFDVLKAFLPSDSPDPKVQYQHRLAITGGLFIVTTVGAVHIALACGYLTAIYPGYASAAEVQGIKQQQVAMLAQQLDTDIFQTREAQCRSTDNGAKILYTQRLQDKIQQWQKLVSWPYRLPDCAEFGTVQSANPVQ